MKRITASILTAFAILIALPLKQVQACTTFCLKNNGEVLFGKNYDWMVGDGLVFVNKRGVAKVASPENLFDSSNTAKWVSKYGSVTFNQYGRENPSGGMNEAGLVIELMWLDDTQYPQADSRPTVGTLEWIQYQLDSASTVAEVVQNAEKVRINSEVKLHYLVNDKAGNTATIEFLNGKLVAHLGDTLPVSTLTNDTYEKSLGYAKTASSENARSSRSLDRFVRAAQRTSDFSKHQKSEADAVNYAFEILSNVAQPGATQWSIVYDQKRSRVHFRTLQNSQIKTIDTKAFDYSCGTVVKLFDMNSNVSGDVTAKFVDYTRKANRDLIERAFNGTDFLKAIPPPFKDQLASHPEQFGCSAKPEKRPVVSLRQSIFSAALVLVTFLS